jgi:hypothetical protein
LKNVVLRLRSVKSLVIAPPKTGSDNNKRIAVTNIDQTKRGKRAKVIPGARLLTMVTIKLIAPKIDEIPAKCKLTTLISTPGPAWWNASLKGGYKVQPVPTPPIKTDNHKKLKAGHNNQKLKLFKRGKAISGAPINIGTIQLPKPPISIGIAAKKIIITPCEVIIALYICILKPKHLLPGSANSTRTK